jgi:hypothetical protein
MADVGVRVERPVRLEIDELMLELFSMTALVRITSLTVIALP